jgi:hypothetical protein
MEQFRNAEVAPAATESAAGESGILIYYDERVMTGS